MKFCVCRTSTRKGSVACRTISGSLQMASPKCTAVLITPGWCLNILNTVPSYTQTECCYACYLHFDRVSITVSMEHLPFHFTCLRGLNNLMSVPASYYYCFFWCIIPFIPFICKLHPPPYFNNSFHTQVTFLPYFNDPFHIQVILSPPLHLMPYKIFIVQEMNSLYAFKCKRFRNTRHTVTFGISLQSSF
jgi:hypothetical protein